MSSSIGPAIADLSLLKERAGNNFPILVVGTLRVPYTSYGTRSVPTTLEQWHIGKLFLARSQRGIAATKEVVNAMVYNFSASCVEVERIESKGGKDGDGASSHEVFPRCLLSSTSLPIISSTPSRLS